MSAEATNPATTPAIPPELLPAAASPGARPTAPAVRKRPRHRIDLRRLGRAALLGPTSRDRLPDAIAHVAEAHRAHHPEADLEALRRAYVLAEASHRGQMRKSGEPYITHPLAVTLILAELGAETTTLVAALLHDTVEDTDVTLTQVLDEFGPEVAYLVDGVTKLEKVDYGAAAEPETFRKMLVATGNDVRVMSIKLADRLHNMRTLGVMRPEKQVRIAKVTHDVLIPLAERLGVQALKTELEDLVFAILHPEEYAAAREIAAAHENAAAPGPLAETAGRFRAVLREAGITADVEIRPRHMVSLHRVRGKRGELRGVDLGRLLVTVQEDADCYAVLGELHTCFTPVVSEFKDFIAVPKFNLYQSLHTAVAREDGEVVEVLIRTRQMHQVAEAGVVALGNPYAPGATGAEDPHEGERADPTRPGWLSRLLDWQRAAPDADTFWSTLREDLAQDGEITVFRTDGGTLSLPSGASCVDAAYAQYGEGAHACIGARVNGRLATLSTVLKDGDTVHPLLAAAGDDASPSPDWLEHARTPAARIAIRRWLHAHPDRPAPGPGTRKPPLTGAAPTPADEAPEAAVTDLPGATVRLAGCCTPVPPDEITGFAVRGGVVTVHRCACPSVARMTASGRDPVGVRWGENTEFRVTLFAESFGRPHLLADLTEAIAAEGVAVISATVEPPAEQRVRHTYTLQLPDAAGLPDLMRAMRDVPGVYDVSRAQRSAAARR
ncbi:RelA/SpoT family protein [Streptomyces koyangensis]|uniref:Bifunctional (P)ppGpp synthetase/guanosine-3',5'-bis(Diphosphate) 3'-pyrophosphohydrolase n=1 Tax=Streptomyces koyangensis TaxID=188770 RepID=A0A385D7L7_9ACTN|nr:HD domain-containing protein [Streptomyces koyangensis]AXQ54355.1 bifunctional (p)ppGpp synthetase/guanosine-3',5'-bis(diphosphate) 3'-pyrophosphohydrolase [Streptomyces koyangensis]WTD05774.1 HD domain-containing protein [Streptomyces albidoflavus]